MADTDLPVEELTRGLAYNAAVRAYDDDAQTVPSDLAGMVVLLQVRSRRGAAAAMLAAASNDATARVQVQPPDAANAPQQGLVVVSLGNADTLALVAGEALAELAYHPADDPGTLTELATWRWLIHEPVVSVAP